MRRKDLILSVGTLALILAALGVVALTGKTEQFAAWAWDRHHNELVHKAPVFAAILLLRL